MNQRNIRLIREDYVRTKVYLCHNDIFLMPKGTKTLGNSKALA